MVEVARRVVQHDDIPKALHELLHIRQLPSFAAPDGNGLWQLTRTDESPHRSFADVEHQGDLLRAEQHGDRAAPLARGEIIGRAVDGR
jgi:hypothetical protein